jgi:hypothetical protein
MTICDPKALFSLFHCGTEIKDQFHASGSVLNSMGAICRARSVDLDIDGKGVLEFECFELTRDCSGHGLEDQGI